MNETLTCDAFFDGTDLHGPTRVVIEAGLVVALEPHVGPAEHPILAPGYVDIQMNGYGAHDVATLDEATGTLLDAELAALGTTTWLATVVTAPLDRLSVATQRLDNLISDGLIPGCAGVHIEGPFLGGAPGAHNPEWIVPFDERWASTLPPSVKLMTIAAEQADIDTVVRFLCRRQVSVSIGHSRPTLGQLELAIDAGASLVTHLYNGMSAVHHRDGGLALWALGDDRLRAGLIADMVHVSPEAVRLAFRAKQDDGICLVSDSVAWENRRALGRGVQIVGGAPRLPDGTLAGSSTPLSECVRNVVKVSKVDEASALRAATSTPARAVGLVDHGVIHIGMSPDIIALDRDLRVLRTWRRLRFVRDQQTDT